MMDLLDDPVPGSNTPEYSVGEIAGVVKKLIEGELGWVRVRGEVGRVVLARSGHLYFDLKDDRNVLSCMTWKGQVPGLGVMPEEGMEVVAEGKMTASGFQSKFSLNAQTIAVAGEGALMALLEKRKKALAAEGLFDEARKQKLPYLPEIIGVVTSPQGAVIRDILHRLRDRFPRKVLIWPVAVQGQACAPQVAAAIEGFNRLRPGGALPRPDLIIVARGGGSIEDLWGFNEEAPARAAAASVIPIISAVGHETDTTLIDFAADRRAPTPTAAAEMAVPVRLDLLAWVQEAEGRLARALSASVTRRGQRLRDLSRALPRPERLLDAPRQRLDRADRLEDVLRAFTDRQRGLLAERAAGLRPHVLSRTVESQRAGFEKTASRLVPALARGTAQHRRDLDAKLRRFQPARAAAEVERARERLAARAKALQEDGAARLARLSDRLEALERLRVTLGYEATLQRGYAIVRADGTVATRKAQAEGAARLEVQFADGVLEIGGASAPAKPGPRKKAAKTDKPEQGSLF